MPVKIIFTEEFCQPEKLISIYSYKADPGYKSGYSDDPGKMGKDSWCNIIMIDWRMIIKISTGQFILKRLVKMILAS